MTEIDQFKEFVADNPGPTVGDPAWRLDENTSQGESSVYFGHLTKSSEVIEQEKNGKRILELIALLEKKESFKHTVCRAMIDRFLVDFDEEETYQARLDIARIIMRLLQYI